MLGECAAMANGASTAALGSCCETKRTRTATYSQIRKAYDMDAEGVFDGDEF